MEKILSDDQLCWCGSKIEYSKCHKDFDLKCLLKEKEGFLIPKRYLIKNSEQIEGIRQAGIINNGLLDLIEKNIAPRLSTEEIDTMVKVYLKENGATSADYHYCGYPKHICTSINDVICHGVPSSKDILKEGDIINVDATTEYKGYYADASRMYVISPAKANAIKLVDITRKCLEEALKTIKPFESTLNDIAIAISSLAHKNGYSVVEDYCGHGVGLKMHEDPYVLHYPIKEKTLLLVPGMCFTIEPMINEGSKKGVIDRFDGWTCRTVDHKLSAQVEHTLVITEDGYEILSK